MTASIAHFIDPEPDGARRWVILGLVIVLGGLGLGAAGLWLGTPTLRRALAAWSAASRPVPPRPRPTPARPTPAPSPTVAVALPLPTPTPAPLPSVTPTPDSTPPPTPAPSSPPERRVPVRFSSEPSGAEITLRGQLLGVTPLTTTLTPGDYTARARYGDWPEATRSFRVPARGVTSVDIPFRLRPPNADAREITPDAMPIPRRERDETTPGRRRQRDEGAPDAFPETPALPAIPLESGGAKDG